MDICGHFIIESEIAGIGPCMYENHPDKELFEVTGYRRLFFHLHLKCQSIMLYSEYYLFAGDNLQLLQQERAKYDEYMVMHKKAYRAVVKLLKDREALILEGLKARTIPGIKDKKKVA